MIVGLYSILLGAFVWAKNKKMLGFSLFTLTLPTGMWLLSVMFGLLSTKTGPAAFWYKLCYFWVSYISVGSLFIASSLTKMIRFKKEKAFILVGYIVMSAFAVISVSTGLMVKYPPRKFYWGFEGNAGNLLLLFLGVWCIWAFKATYNVFMTYRNAATSLEKRKFLIFLNTYLFGYLAVVDYFGDFGIAVYPAGFIFIGTYISLLAYNMIRYKAFEIETVIHRTVLWLLASVSVFLPLVLFIYLARPWLSQMNVLLLSFLMTVIFYLFKYYQQVFQPRIDHIFRRKKYDYSQILGVLSLSLKGVLDIETISGKVSSAIKGSLYLQKIGILIMDIKTGQPRPLVRAGFSGEIPALDPQDKVLSYLKINPYLERELVEVDPNLSYLKESRLYQFLKEEDTPLVLSLNLKEEFIGLIILGKRENLQLFTVNDIGILSNIASEVALYFYNALHHEDILEKQRLDEEMRFGREIQMGLLPQRVPEISNLALRGLMQPAKEIGGDYYDFVTFPNKNNLAIVIGDVSGKGVAAGLLMSMVKAAIHTLSQEEASPKEVLQRTNQMLYQNIGGQRFMTLLYLLWDSQNRILTYSSAGHEHILIFRNKLGNERVALRGTSPDVEAIISGGFMLGMLSDIDSYLEEKQLKLENGDKILLYTDGVTEAENENLERFGLGRLEEAFQKHSSKPANELMLAIKDEVYSFIGAHPQYDDITLVVLEAQ
ncbi:MAG: SpoIIE family protein phosphatase [Candidatus Omnitrophica bacterium]|nr:SpoIIE family protein phosphatase [Candidatus Omnitrophota bacterium]